AVGHALGEGYDVGLHAPVLDRAHARARAAPAGLDLVDDQQAAGLLDDGLYPPEVVLWGHDEPADALDGFGDEGGDAPFRRRPDHVLDLGHAQVEVRGLRHAGRAPVHVRVAHVLDVAVVDQAAAPRRLPCQAHGCLGPAAVAVTQRDHVGAARVHAGRHDRLLVGLASRAGEERDREVPGRDVAYLLRESYRYLVDEERAGVLSHPELADGRLGHLFVE